MRARVARESGERDRKGRRREARAVGAEKPARGTREGKVGGNQGVGDEAGPRGERGAMGREGPSPQSTKWGDRRGLSWAGSREDTGDVVGWGQ